MAPVAALLAHGDVGWWNLLYHETSLRAGVFVLEAKFAQYLTDFPLAQLSFVGDADVFDDVGGVHYLVWFAGLGYLVVGADEVFLGTGHFV